MITAQKPWHSRHNEDGSIEIFDGNGHRIALFRDHRDADHVIELVNHMEVITGAIDSAIDKITDSKPNEARRILEAAVA